MNRFAALILAAAPLAAGACSSAAASGEPRELTNYEKQAYLPDPGRAPLTTGELMFECERHLRVWQEAMAMQRTEKNRETIWFTEKALGAIVHREKEELKRQAVSGPPRNRAIASAALAFSDDPDVLPLIVSNVRDPEPMVAANALLGVGVMASPETPFAPLHDAVVDPLADDHVVSNAAYASLRLAQALRHDPDGNLSAILFPLLGHADPNVRAQAVTALGLVRAGHAVPQISELLAHDDSRSVRTACAYSLGEIGSPGSITVLVAALDDSDRITAGTARGSLVKIHGKDLGPDPEAWQAATTIKRP